MAARQPTCLSAEITEPAGTAQRTGTPRAEVPSCWDGTELKASNSAQTPDRLPGDALY